MRKKKLKVKKEWKREREREKVQGDSFPNFSEALLDT